MTISALLGADETAEAAFKREGEGWLFQTPPMRGLFGVARAYRVTDAQKAVLKADYQNTFIRSFVVAMVFVPIGLLAHALGVGLLAMMFTVAIGASLVSLAFWIPYFGRLKRMLGNEPPAEGRITYTESIGTLVRVMSMRRAVSLAALSAVLLAGFIFGYVKGIEAAASIIGMVIFGINTLYLTGVVVAKLVGRRAPVSE